MIWNKIVHLGVLIVAVACFIKGYIQFTDDEFSKATFYMAIACLNWIAFWGYELQNDIKEIKNEFKPR